ncbi:alpha/beta hydrolase [Agromyces sp. ISL-38]|uniref:alpha/beta fold hydrolase n=1 Tax=Agromyces sp. ISL-38 TaxID=2819107 RepID=UPI001BEAFD6D|nr:alpha/beta hydrolase [Agromyces sp. ISL-38]MBT2499220.1 alpha/beta hydrolase [Agromyces sp. ISL-38]
MEFDGMTVAYRCTGDGSPAVILEAGSDSPGTGAWPAAFIAPIAEVTMVCTYNRLGTGGGSSEPPDRGRTWDDIASVLDGVLGALELEPPYVIGGQSGGGNVAIAYAFAHPDRVAALVSIEAYHDDPAEMADWQAEEGFTWEGNPEHFDVVPASTQQDAYPMPIGEFPVLIISATQADPGGAENQAYWLGLSPDSRQVVIEGPHDLQWAAPKEVAAEIVDLLAGLPVVE